MHLPLYFFPHTLLRSVEYKILIFKSVCLWLIIFHFDNTKIKEDKQNNHASNMYAPTGGIYEKFIFWRIKLNNFPFSRKNTHIILSIALYVIFSSVPPSTASNNIHQFNRWFRQFYCKYKVDVKQMLESKRIESSPYSYCRAAWIWNLQ